MKKRTKLEREDDMDKQKQREKVEELIEALDDVRKKCRQVLPTDLRNSLSALACELEDFLGPRAVGSPKICEVCGQVDHSSQVP